MTLLAEPSTLDLIEPDRPLVRSKVADGVGPGGAWPPVVRDDVLLARAFPDRSAGAVPLMTDDPATALAARDDEEVTDILADVDTLVSGTPEERLRAVFSLAERLPSDEIERLTADLDIDDPAVLELLGDEDALAAAATLASAEASDGERVAAAITLTESIGALADGRLADVLEGPLAAIGSGPELIAAIETFLDPEASALEKADAALAFGVAAVDSLSELSPALARDLRNLGSLGRSLGAALTVFDPDASPEERAEAVLALFADVPEVHDDLSRLNRRLVDRILGEHADIAFDLPEGLPDSLDPAVRAALTPEQVFRLQAIDGALVAEGSGRILVDLLATTDSPASIEHLLTALEAQPDVAARKALIETLQEIAPERLDELLAGTIDGRPAAIALAETVGRLDPAGQAAFRSLLGDLDPRALDFLVRTIDLADSALVSDVLRHADRVDGRQLGQVLGLLAEGLDRAGIRLTAETAGTLLRGLGKFVPGLGAVAAGHAAYEHGTIVANGDYPPDIRYLASLGVKINAGDAALSIVEAFTAWTGVSVAADIGIGGAGLLVDLLVADQVARFEAARDAGEAYEPPEWLTAANVAAAGAQGPVGWTEFWGIYGVDGGIEALSTATTLGGELAIHAAEGLLLLGTDAVGAQFDETAESLHLLADIIRNPEVYGERAVEFGERAVERLAEIADGVGALADAARDRLGDLVDDLRSLGADGLRALGWIATHPGDVADLAIEALGDVAGDLLEAGGAALQEALDVLDAVARFGEAAEEAVVEALVEVTERAVALGEAGIAVLGTIARNPGRSARIAAEALADVAAQAGELAELAVDELVELGEEGLELLEDVAGRLVELGEDGIDTLVFIATRPDEAGRIALDTLSDVVSAGGEFAVRAGEEIVRLVEDGYEEAKAVAEHLILEGGEAFRNVLVALGDEIGDGIVDVLDGLADVGDAARERLVQLGDAGFDFARDGLEDAADAISDLGSWVWNRSLPGRIWNHFGN